MLKKTLFTAMFAVLFLAAPAMAADWDGTPWDREWDCTGGPPELEAAGFTHYNSWNSGRFNDNYNLAVAHVTGWVTGNGNGGGGIGIEWPYYGLTKAAGWTVEWKVVTANYQDMGNILVINDDSHMARIRYNVDEVTLADGYPVAGGGTGGVSTYVDLTGLSEHTFRLVRQPGSDTIELYIDWDLSYALQITPFFVINPIYADESNLNSVSGFDSLWEASWDFLRLHSGATITPEPVTLLVLALGGLAALVRRKR